MSDNVQDRESEYVRRLRGELMNQWTSNHYEHCSEVWPHAEGDMYPCMWPLPAILTADRTEVEHQSVCDTAPQTDLDVALGAFGQYVDTGDDCYLDNLTGEELRELAKRLGRQAREAKNPGLRFTEDVRREQEFAAAYPRLYCPACRKRLSPVYDNIDAMHDRPQVRISCRHCGHRFDVPRSPR